MRYVPSPCGAMTWASQILSNSVRACGIGLLQRKSGLGFGGGLALQLVARALGDARRPPGAATQVIELGPANRSPAHHFDRGDAWRIEWKDALYPLAVRDLAQRKV